MNTVLLLFSAVCLTLLVPSSIRAGGEIGNHRYVTYEDKLLEMETVYPEPWAHLSYGLSVSFVENDQPAKTASVVNISSQNLAAVHTVTELEQYLRLLQPAMEWRAVSLAGKDGFEGSSGNGSGLIYLLRSDTVVVSVRYRQRDEQRSKVDVGTILQALQLK